MGLFDKLISRFVSRTESSQLTKPELEIKEETSDYVTITITGSAAPSVEVSDTEVAERVREHAFVLTTDPPALKTADQWWNEDTHKRRRRDGSEKAYSWLLPFIPMEISKLKQLYDAQEWGPHGALSIAKELRALIRARRKSKESYQELLHALYGACIAKDLSASLEFEGTQPHYMAQFVDINDFKQVNLDYMRIGYLCIKSLSKTDVKWLIEVFGEPAEHQSFDYLWPHIRRNAIARYCWGQLRRSNESAKSLGLPQKTMQEWLDELARQNIGYYKEWQERVNTRKANQAELATSLEEAWSATRQPFIVADLETTGLNSETDEVLELAAVLVTPDGTITREFSTLVRASILVPSEITRITGITQDIIDQEGRPLTDAMKEFVTFAGSHPVFFHNAPFDKKFIKKAINLIKMNFDNPIHDTLPMARQAWPSLSTYKLGSLAQYVAAPAPKHRALGDAKATLSVLLAARQAVMVDK